MPGGGIARAAIARHDAPAPGAHWGGVRVIPSFSTGTIQRPFVSVIVFLEYHVLREEEDPHADTRAGIDASWLVCRGADYALRLWPTPRVAQALVSRALSEIALPARSRVGWTASRHFHVVCDLEASDLESEPVCTSRASASIPGVCRGHPSRATEKKFSLLFGS